MGNKGVFARKKNMKEMFLIGFEGAPNIGGGKEKIKKKKIKKKERNMCCNKKKTHSP